jgi:SAM-dependent methyltransferase
VNEENRRHLLRFVDRHLKPGGLLYLSYNALPGWNQWLPIQRLLVSAAAQADGDPKDRFAVAAKLIDDMAAADAAYLKDNPALAEFRQLIEDSTDSYLVHEFLIPTWRAFHANEVTDELC